MNTTISSRETEVLLVLSPSIMEVTFSYAKSLYKPVEPLGLMYIAACLLQEGIATKILDCNAEELTVEQSVGTIKKINPGIIGIPCLTQEAFMVETLLTRLREELPDTPIIMGNVHANCFPEYYLKKGFADVIVNGEGELVMPELVRRLQSGSGFDGQDGIFFLDEQGELVTRPRKPVPDLDALPYPAWELVNLKNYKNHFYYNFDPKRTRIMITSRGCPIGCSFCTIHEDRKVRYQSPERVVDEIEFLVKKYGTTQINFFDPMFLAKRSRVTRYCELLLERNINIKWSCEAHVNYADEELFNIMKRAGCQTLFFGIEAGDNQLLENVGKRSTVDRIEKAIAMADRARLKPVGLFMLGLPGETEELSHKTIDFSMSLPLDMAVFSITVPFPGSRLFEELKERDPNFDQYNWDGFNNTGMLGKHPPVWNTEAMNYEQLTRLQSLAYRTFHLRPKMIWRHLKTFRYATWEDVLATFYVGWLSLTKR